MPPVNNVDVVTFGEVLANFVAQDDGHLAQVNLFRRRLGGAEANVAVGLARLGHRVRLLGLVGSDPFGEHARALLAAEQVDTCGLLTDPDANTGFQLKDRVAHGDPTIVYFRRGSAGSRLAWAGHWKSKLVGARHLHATGIPPALSASARDFARAAMRVAREDGQTVSFDPNLRPRLWPSAQEMVAVVNDLARYADWVLPGLDEGRLLTGRDSAEGIAEFYLGRGARQVVVKNGAQGATLFTVDGRWHAPAVPVRVIDTVGAGDGFAAGLISAHLHACGPQEALRRAATVGALATTSDGDMDGLPTRDQLDRFLATPST